MIPCDLERKILEAQLEGKNPFYVAATSGTTVLGAFDPIPAIAALCKRHGLWLHVDVSNNLADVSDTDTHCSNQ